MQIKGHEHLGHLGYCTNIHAGEAWSDMIASLNKHVPDIRDAVAPGQPFGIGLRLGAAVTQDLADPALMQELITFLKSSDSYVFSINGFPYGPFHAQTVKENVYAPDWSTPERLDYTNSLADILVQLLLVQDYGTISTVPGTFKPWAEGNIDAIAHNLLEHVVHLIKLKQTSGKTIALALEPEPFCLLETIAETTEFFSRYLFCDTAVKHISNATGLSTSEAALALREHIGVCYDVCHAAVEYESPAQSIAALRSAEIAIAKVQLSSALRIEQVGADAGTLLKRFNEPVYLHQVIEKKSDQLKRYLDLPEALGNLDAALGAEWRIHFHVPVFLEALKHFGTTQFFLREILALHREQPISTHLEVETYTWDVLPDEYRNVDVSVAIAREMQWVLGQLSA